MTKWIAQIEVEAEAVLPDGASPFEYADPRGDYRLKLVNRAVRPLAETPLLEMQLEFDASDLKTAADKAKELSRRFLHWLSFVTCCGFRVRRLERVVDWTPGLTMREQMIYHTDRTDLPQSVVIQDLAPTIALFNAEDVAEEVQRALRWFAKGVSAEWIDEQFHCFFFTIEILAEFKKSPTPVPDQCPKCHGELFCRHCNEVPTHRPYARQAIKALLATCITGVGGAEAAFADLNRARSRVMHGKHHDEIEGELSVPFDKLVDRAGHIAWTCLVNSMRLPPGKHQLCLLQANTFVKRALTMGAHVHMGSPRGDPQNPRLEDLGKLEISVMQGDRPGVAMGPPIPTPTDDPQSS